MAMGEYVDSVGYSYDAMSGSKHCIQPFTGAPAIGRLLSMVQFSKELALARLRVVRQFSLCAYTLCDLGPSWRIESNCPLQVPLF